MNPFDMPYHSVQNRQCTRRMITIGDGYLILAIVFSFIHCTNEYTLKDILNVPVDDEHIGREELQALDNVDAYLEEKRAASCPPWKPFQCPEGTCIPLKYLCDYNVDCTESGYDENKKLCTAMKRRPVEETEEFMNGQLQEHGDDYFVKLFGSKASNRMQALGGVSVVAVALTESPRLSDFASSVNLTPDETDHLRKLLKMISQSDKTGLAALNFKESEIDNLQPVVEQLVDTGFLKADKR